MGATGGATATEEAGRAPMFRVGARAGATVLFLLAVVVVLASRPVVYGEAQPLALSTDSHAPPPHAVAANGGRIFYLSVVRERRAPWDVLTDVVGRHNASAPRVAVSPGPDSASGDRRSREAAITAWQTAERLALGTVRTATPPAWPAVGALHGDSAGLAYLLRYLDVLLPGDVTGGVDLAATGVIGADGSIEPVGGVDHKTAAARSAGVSVVFLPATNDLGAVPTATARSDELLGAARSAGLWPWQSSVQAVAPYAAGGATARNRPGTTVVGVSEPVEALAWLCGYTGGPAPCRAAATLLRGGRG